MTPAELRAARRALAMTQAEFAQATGKHPSLIAHQEAGRRGIDKVDAMAVCHLLLTRLKPRLKRWTLERLIEAVSEGQPKQGGGTDKCKKHSDLTIRAAANRRLAQRNGMVGVK